MNIISVFHYPNGTGLETRVCGVLLRNHITTLEELKEKTDYQLLCLKGIGIKGLNLIHEKLETYKNVIG